MDEERHTATRPWDAGREVPVIEDEQTPWKLVKLLKFFSLCLVSLLVFGLAICSKTSFLLLITLAGNASHTVPADHKPVVLLSVGCAVIAPTVLLLLKSFWKVIFKSSKPPAKGSVVMVLFVEFLVALGSAVLAIVAMPFLDIVTNVMLLNSIAIFSSVSQVVAQSFAVARKRIFIPSIVAIVLILAGYVVFLLLYLLDGEKRTEMALWVGLAVAGTFLASLNWWENYIGLLGGSSSNGGNRITKFFKQLSEDLKNSRNVLYLYSSVLRILVTAAVLGAYVYLSKRDWTSLKTVPDGMTKIVGILIGVQLISSALCHWFVVVACKMHAMRRSFILPLYLASLGTLTLLVAPVIVYFVNHRLNTPGDQNFTEYCAAAVYSRTQRLEGGLFQRIVLDVTQTLCNLDLGRPVNIGLLTGSAAAFWVSLLLATLHLWFFKLHRIQRTEDLFIRRNYEGGFLEQSLLLNVQFDIEQTKQEKYVLPKEPVTVYLCATMWHETYDEMMKIIISMFRLDRYRPKDMPDSDINLEAHIYFDDAFTDVKGSQGRHVNDYAETLVEVIQRVYSIFTEDDTSLFRKQIPVPDQKLLSTPYGGRLQVTLPLGNILIVHFKDKKLIRHKKRWSQIMYLYYLLGWKLMTKYFRKWEDINIDQEEEAELKRQMKKEKHNTYILALDGDTDFQPAAVILLIDRLKMYPLVGAACGRIHPTGSGPMVWYQKFEYAVGHWLQKTAEHVFGSVLCSPGCFSLFRAEALMDDNVMKKYTTKATEASHHIQYDQGEDRWLCTLLLQRGWRVEYNAASDAYTNAPEGFKEFYNQRRRWGPSTMANIVDVLGSGSTISKRNKSVSQLYILYQLLNMVSVILVPATICLMIAGILTFLFEIEPNNALILAVIPPAAYLGLCFKLKSDTQIAVASFMSVIYAFLMLIMILTTIATIVRDNTIVTPSSLFILTMVFFYIFTAMLHPQEFSLVAYGLLYILCIPSAYLLLSIYSMVNMNNVSWGTRETAPAAGAAKTAAAAPQTRIEKAKSTMTRLLQQARCCKCPCSRPGGEYMAVSQENLEPEPQNTIVEEAESFNGEARQEDPSQHVHQSWVSQLQNLSRTDIISLREDSLDEDEEQFWKDLQKQYLEPEDLAETKRNQKKMDNDLKDLRNKVTFAYFMCNSMWLVATFTLQLLDNAISIRVPKIDSNLELTGEFLIINPVGFMFLMGFASLIFIQFVAMLYHRVYTLIHYVAFVGTESNNRGQQDRRQSETRDMETPDYRDANRGTLV